jgi:hypothetical protein
MDASILTVLCLTDTDLVTRAAEIGLRVGDAFDGGSREGYRRA